MKTNLIMITLKSTFAILLMFLLNISAAFAQSPDKLSYQAVVRDAGGVLVTSQAIGMKISILQFNASGTAVYVETHTPSTNDNGLVTIEIGDGTVVSGDFGAIDWSDGPYFVKVETDPAGGTNYSIVGTSQLLSVPYAMHANSLTNIKTNTSAGTVDITSPDDYAILHIRPTQDQFNDSSVIFMGEGFSEVVGMKFHYDGVANEMRIIGQSGSNLNTVMTLRRDNGDAIFTKGVKIEESTTTPAPATAYANALPVAYGYVAGSTISQDYGVTSMTNSTTGVYEITLDNDFAGAPVVLVTSFNSSNDTEVATYSFQTPNKITVRIVNENNAAANSNFSFVVFGTPQ